MLDIVIADDHAITREGLKLVVENSSESRVVGEAADGIEAVHLTQRHHPEILIFDLGLPGMNGFDVLRQVRRLSPDTKVIVLSMHGDAEYVVQAFRDGAAAYVLKGSAAGDLLEALKVVRRGETYLGRGLSPSILKSSVLQEDLSDQERYSTLTHREREVMQLIAEGLTSQEIGERLFISRRTVDKHREKIMSKLDLKNQTEIVRFALRRGLVRDPESSASPEFE